jgi:hypothetical protein
MISKIKAGILSAIGLMLIYFFEGILYIPDLDVSNPRIYLAILQIGFLWFNISLWISMRYVLVVLNNLPNFKIQLNWIIFNLAAVGGFEITYIIFPDINLYIVIYILSTVVIINIIILIVRIYRLGALYLNNIKYLRRYLISIIFLAIMMSVLKMVNERVWHSDIEYIDSFLSVIPQIFLISFFKHEKKDVIDIQNASA